MPTWSGSEHIAGISVSLGGHGPSLPAQGRTGQGLQEEGLGVDLGACSPVPPSKSELVIVTVDMTSCSPAVDGQKLPGKISPPEPYTLQASCSALLSRVEGACPAAHQEE